MTSTLPKLTIQARLGASADIALRLETSVLKFVAITGMAKTAPLRVTATSHGIPDMWYAAVIDSRGMTEMNAADSNKIRELEFHQITVIDANTVDFMEISAASFSAYTGGGYLAYYEPLDLSGYTSARMDIKRAVGATAVLSLHTDDGTLEIDAAASSVWIRLSPTALSDAGVTARDYYFDIELIRPDGVDAICAATSVATVLPEITTST